jgi:hypothetical protein
MSMHGVLSRSGRARGCGACIQTTPNVRTHGTFTIHSHQPAAMSGVRQAVLSLAPIQSACTDECA